jgi:hypothetical protein
LASHDRSAARQSLEASGGALECFFRLRTTLSKKRQEKDNKNRNDDAIVMKAWFVSDGASIVVWYFGVCVVYWFFPALEIDAPYR